MTHYLDYAATSAIRPPSVAEAVATFLTDCGATQGRGGHELALEAGRLALRCRRLLCQVLGLPGDPGRLAFTYNATHAINTALWGTLGRGDAVVVTAYDHNAVLRPAHALAGERDVDVRFLPGSPDGSVDPDALGRLLDGAALLVVNAASNVLGTRAPLAEMADLAHSAGALVLLDVAQSAGHFPTSAAADGADLVAVTGHKGLLGPQGIGGLWVSEGCEVDALLRGGTGGNSLERDMPTVMPDRLEAGTQNSPGMAGLCAGIEHVLGEGVAAIHERETELKLRLRDGLDQVAGARTLSPEGRDGVGIVTITSDTVDAPTLARRLGAEFGVMARAGLHCAPEAHALLGTTETGALRLSVGWATTEEDVDRAIEGVDAICRQPAVSVS